MTDIYFTDEHEYIKVEGDIGIVGISDYAQNALGDVVYVELPKVGAVLNQGDEAGVVESVKSASEIYAPVSGEIVEINERLNDTPDLVNQDPMEDAWFYKIKISDPTELEGLKNEADYTAYTDDL